MPSLRITWSTESPVEFTKQIDVALTTEDAEVLNLIFTGAKDIDPGLTPVSGDAGDENELEVSATVQVPVENAILSHIIGSEVTVKSKVDIELLA